MVQTVHENLKLMYSNFPTLLRTNKLTSLCLHNVNQFSLKCHHASEGENAQNSEECLHLFCDASSLCCENLDIRDMTGLSWRPASPQVTGRYADEELD